MGVQWGDRTKVQLGAWKNEWSQKCNGCMALRLTTMRDVLLGMGIYYKLNDHPVRERVTTSNYYTAYSNCFIVS